jgi:hypothetical protein
LGNGDATFQAAPTYATGTTPVAEAVGDFNGDGNLDLAVVNQGSNTVSVLLGNGDGTFQAAVNYTVGNSPDAIAVGDFNGDGKLDLAVANRNSNTVSILLGNGDGTFQTAISVPVGAAPVSLAAGDLNGDGLSDLVVGQGSVRILISNGDGTFQSTQDVTVRSGLETVALADVNGDGNLDLIVATMGHIPGFPGGVGVFLGNGDGTFQATGTYYGASFGITSVTVGDLNGDGFPDFVAAGPGPNVFLNNGDGTFRAGSSLSTGSLPALADVNGNGTLDLVGLASGGVKVLLGNGDGTFQTSNVIYVTGSGASFVAIGDFNNDGFPDLVTANSTDNNISVLLNSEDGTAPSVAGRRLKGAASPVVLLL